MRFRLLSALLLSLPVLIAHATEPHAEDVLRSVRDTRAQLMVRFPEARFLAFWDFDGTLLQGDCSEGWTQDGRLVYPGLAQVAIERGYAAHYRGPEAFARFWSDYQYLDNRIGHWLAYPFLPQIFSGAKVDDLTRLSREHFEHTLHPFFFASSLHVLRALEDDGVENHVLSASADFFVRGASQLLQLPESRFHGLQLAVQEGLVTTRILYPVTYADGKTEVLLRLVSEAQRETPSRPVFVLAGFGNSYSTDGPFLHFIAQMDLPVGHTEAVMINGGTPREGISPRLRRVEQKELRDALR